MPRQYTPWRTSEVAIMRELYPSGGWKAVQALLPGRSVTSIHQAARYHGIKLSPEYKSELSTMSGNARWKMAAPSWSEDEREILRNVYPDGGWKAVHELLPHRSKSSICRRASIDEVRSSEAYLLKVGRRNGAMGGRPRITEKITHAI